MEVNIVIFYKRQLIKLAKRQAKMFCQFFFLKNNSNFRATTKETNKIKRKIRNMSDSCDSSVSFIKQNDGKRNIDCEDIEIISNYQEVVTQAEELRKLKAAIQESEVREKMQALKI